MNAPRNVSYQDYLIESLKDLQEAAYMDAAMKLKEPSALMLALGQVAKALGMAEVARRADIGEKTLFRALSKNVNPTVSTLHKVLHAVGLRLSVTPEHA